jgi:hypothetical protein
MGAVELAHEFTFTADLEPPVTVGQGPFGGRDVYTVTGGTVTGERLAGTLLPGGGDWVLVGADGFGRLDVRLTIRTHDDAFIYVQYLGLIEYNDVVLAVAAGERSSDFGDHYYRIAPRLETGDPRYAWVNKTLFAGRGRLLLDEAKVLTVEYEVWRVL